MLHHEVEELFFLPDRVNRNDMGMTEGARGPCLPLEPLRDVCLLRDAVGDDLDRDLAVELDTVAIPPRPSSVTISNSPMVARRRRSIWATTCGAIWSRLRRAVLRKPCSQTRSKPHRPHWRVPGEIVSPQRGQAFIRPPLRSIASRFARDAASLVKSRPIPGVRPGC